MHNTCDIRTNCQQKKLHLTHNVKLGMKNEKNAITN
jgi:hypothetical protein